jgi:hypothetical protein
MLWGQGPHLTWVEKICSFEMSVDFQRAIRCYIPEDRILLALLFLFFFFFPLTLCSETSLANYKILQEEI